MTSKEETINAVLDLYRSSGPAARTAINKTAKILWPDTDWTKAFERAKQADASDMSEGVRDVEDRMYREYADKVMSSRR